MLSKKINLSIVLTMFSISIISQERTLNDYLMFSSNNLNTARLMQAIDKNDLQAFNNLLIQNYDIVHSTFIDPLTFDDINPIHYAAQKGNKAMIETLLKRGVSIDEGSSSNKTPLYFAIMSNQNVEFIKFLLQKGAYPFATDNFNNTLLDATLKARDDENEPIDPINLNLISIQNLLIDNGLNPENVHSTLINLSNFPEISNTAEPLQVNEELECPICQESISDAKTNCCKQPICKKCVVDMNLRELYSCPICRHPKFTVTSTKD